MTHSPRDTTRHPGAPHHQKVGIPMNDSTPHYHTEAALHLGDNFKMLLTLPDASDGATVTVEIEEGTGSQPSAPDRRRGLSTNHAGGPDPGCPCPGGAFRGPPGRGIDQPYHRTRYVLSLRAENKSGEASVPAAVAAAARATNSVDQPTPRVAPARASVPEIAQLLLEAFAEEGDPESVTVAQLADWLEEADPATWGRWAGRTDRLAMVGRTIRARLRAAGLDVSTVRMWNLAGGPAAYRLADIREALS